MKTKTTVVKKTTHKLLIIITLQFILFCDVAISQQEKQYVKNFTQKQYGQNLSVQNWSVTQTNNGLMYFGNYNQVLQFDGNNWETIKITPTSGYITALQANNSEQIFVGATNEFGFIRFDKDGNEKYISLSSNLAEKEKDFGTIWRIFLFNNTVIFFSQTQIFEYKNGKILSIKPTYKTENTFHLAFASKNTLFVRERNLGLLEYKNGELNYLKNSDVFKNLGIFGMFSQKNKHIIVTQEAGIFYYYPQENKFEKIISDNTDKLMSYRIMGGIPLNDNNIALNTETNGIVIINENGEIIQEINKKTGLIDNDVKQILQDKYNDLWAVTGNGISRINYASPISFYNEQNGLYGNVQTAANFNNKTYVATSVGLFVEDANQEFSYFKRIENFNKGVYSLVNVNNELLVGTKDGMFCLNEQNKISQITNVDATKILWFEPQKLLISIGINGLYIHKFEKKWSVYKFNNEITVDVIDAEIQLSENAKNFTIWIATSSTGVWKVDFDEKLNIIYDVFIGNEDGLDEGWTRCFKTNEKIYFSTVSGVLKFVIPTQTSGENKKESLRGYFDKFDGVKIPDNAVIMKYLQNKNDVFAIVDNKILNGKNNEKLTSNKFKAIDNNYYNNLIINKNKLNICTNEGFIIFDISKYFNENEKPTIFLSQITSLKNKVLHKLNSKNNKKTEVDYELNTLTFNYSSLYNFNGKKALYSYKLDGYDEQWSTWTNLTEVKYQKLFEGDYTFKLKAKTIFDTESEVLTYSFTVNNPWYRSFLAYLLYTLTFIFLIYIFIKLYTARLKAQNIQLEKIVKERTEEVVKQKDEIEQQKNEIVHIHKEVTDSINYAERIQFAVLPSQQFINEAFNEHFILFKPKDIVSGDFYWAYKIDNSIIISAVDCTGHGVPGAFMSMLGMSFLNEIIADKKNITASEILDALRQRIINALKQKGVDGEQKDGMDMSLCIIDLKTQLVQWAGANNPLYILTEKELNILTENTIAKKLEDENLDVKNKILYEIKQDKMPVAHFVIMNKFQNNVFQLNKGDKLYMFTDGYADQFGGPKGKKYKYLPFKSLIVNSSNKRMCEQKIILNNSIEEWKLHTNPHTGKNFDQIDDICVIGIKL